MHRHAMPVRLLATLSVLVPVAESVFRDPWWIIGSSAMRLSGIAGIEPNDVDLLCSADDVGRLTAAWSEHLDAGWRPGNGNRFRSRFARFVHLPMPLEAMGDLQVDTDAGWQDVRIGASLQIACEEGLVSVPTWEEQIRILRLFGRGKDLAKADLITCHLQAEPSNAP